MPAISKPLPEIRRDLQDLFVEALPEGLKALRDLLPEGTDKYGQVLNLIGRLNAANKDKRDGVIDFQDYDLRISGIRRDALDLVAELIESDFTLPAENKKNVPDGAKQGIILYQVPGKMPIQKPTICRIRVALDEDAVYEDLVLTPDVKTRVKVEVSEFMSAELTDAEGDVFEIKELNSKQQNIRDTGYTQWLFQVRPKIAGIHQLLVKVSLLEFDRNTNQYIPRDISLLETVTIVTDETEQNTLAETPNKTAQERIPLAPEVQQPNFNPAQEMPDTGPISESKQIEYTEKNIEAPVPIFEKIEESKPEPIKKETFKLPQAGKYAALFLAFLMAGTTGAWALTPPPVRDWWKASIIDTAEAYQDYINTWDKTKADNPRVDKAYYFKAERSGRLEDLRAYQKEIGARGVFKEKVRERISEQETKAVEYLEKQADLPLLQRFLTDYPDATQLSRLKAIVEQHLPETQKTEALTLLEQAYVRSMSSDPQPQKFKQYVQDFPKLARLSDMAAAAASDHQVLNALQSDIDLAIVKKTTAAESLKQTNEALQTLEQYGSDRVIKQINDVIEKKSMAIRRVVDKRLDAATNAVQKRGVERREQRTQEDQKSGKTGAVEENTELGKNLAQNEPTTKPVELPAAAALSLEMVPVPAGDFMMGDLFDEGSANEKPVHGVSLSAFEIGKYEVTQALWFAIMNERPSQHKICDECPVENVSWNEVQEFLKQLNDRFPGRNYRLPTEAEWEYAARECGKKVRFANGENIADPEKINFDGRFSHKQSYSLSGLYSDKTLIVGILRSPNALGLHDMSGNVEEWCSDWYGNYTTENQKNPHGSTTGSVRVVRGGAWVDYPQYCRVAYRRFHLPGDRSHLLGFRLARTK